MSYRAAALAAASRRRLLSQPSPAWRRSADACASPPRAGAVGAVDFHSHALSRRNDDDDDDHRSRQVRSFHASPPSERAVALILGLTTLSALGYAGSAAVQSYEEYKASQPTPEEAEEQRKKEEAETGRQRANSEGQRQEGKAGAEEAPRTNVFKEWFGVGVGSKYYEGGFEEKMTRREAALILGVRESSSAKRIKEAHRKLLILNHPDTGGSTYLSGKLNEAKELLLKGKR